MLLTVSDFGCDLKRETRRFRTSARHMDGQRPSPRTSMVASAKLTARTTNGAEIEVPIPKIVRCRFEPCNKNVDWMIQRPYIESQMSMHTPLKRS